MKVKICGIKRIEDALKAVELGADALGFLIEQRDSSNFISEDEAKTIINEISPFCDSVLVTSLEDISQIISIAKNTGVTTIQLHGESTPEDVKLIKEQIPHVGLIKCIHVIDENSIQAPNPYLPFVDAILLDTCNSKTGQTGGTGLTHDWNISKKIVETCNKPVIIAGGLTPDNVADAIESLNPFGVDVSSGVKGYDGFKDNEKLKEFIFNAKYTLLKN